jgi:predicted butyrate kinase (DUF1464 family)
MNPVLVLLQELLVSQKRTELYLSGLFSMEIARLGLMTPEQLVDIISSINESIHRSVEAERARSTTWPAKNLAA